MSLALRDYQEAAVQAVMTADLEGVKRQIVAMPTGAGKTITFAQLIRLMNRRTLILCQRDELIQQACDKLRLVWPDVNLGVVKAQRDEYKAQVVVASVQSLHKKRRERIKGENFTLCIIDECHHAVSNGHKAVLEDLGFLSGDQYKLAVGFTATPFRADGSALADIFQAVTYRIGLLDLIEQGYLVDPVGYRVETSIDLSGVHTRQGDFVTGELAKAVNTPARNRLVVAKYCELAPDRQAVVFSVDVQHAADLAQSFRDDGIPSLHVYGDMALDDRRAALSAFEREEIKVLCNAQLLTEGWDCPSTSAVIMARPTRSQVLYLQCVGRGLRPAPNKQDCVVIDFGDTAHDLLGLPDMLGDDRPKRQRNGASLKEMAADRKRELDELEQERKRALEVARIRAVRQTEMNLLGGVGWQMVEDEWRLPITNRAWATVSASHDGLYDASLFTPSGAQDVATNESLPIAQRKAQQAAAQYRERAFGKSARWRKDPPSEKQLATLKRMGWHGAMPTNKGAASDLLDSLMGARQATI